VAAAITTGIAAAYPVGSIYINAAVATNPATLLGFGTWSAFGAGRVMVGLDAGNAAFDTAQETGGSADAIVVTHSHSISDPGHSHTLDGLPISNTGNNQSSFNFSSTIQSGRYNPGMSTASTGISVNSTGSSATNANLPPYIVVYMWRRTA